jgi:LDH2 family malate/lactate/ureidoglycolate dehydrogenase
MSGIEYKTYKYEYLRNFSYEVFKKLGVPEEDASIPGEALLKADLMGDPSHGIIRMKRYTWRFDEGLIEPKPNPKVAKEGPGFILYDADNGLGQIAATKAMRLCIEKAKKSGIVFALVINSNHFGKCGYYSSLALEHNMIGLSMTNSAPLVAPTFGIEPIIGTNPIAISVPAGEELPFCLDMATSVRAYGRSDIRSREGKDIPLGWGMDYKGGQTIDPLAILGTKGYGHSGGERGSMLPLGGFGDNTAGYKGYSLAVMVDILTGILGGSAWGPYCGISLDPTVARISHLVGVINIETFRPLDEFKKDMDSMLKRLKTSEKAVGYDQTIKAVEDGFDISLRRGKKFKRIYTAGEKGLELENEQLEKGVRLGKYIVEELEKINKQYNIGYKF